MSARQTLMIDPSWQKRWQVNPSRTIEWSSAANDVANQEVCATVSRHVPVWLFVSSDGDRVTSSLPVSVEIREEAPDEECDSWAFVFSCHRLHVFASGSTYGEAENSFHDQVVHFFHTYKAAEVDDLDDDAQTIKSLYDKYFSESALHA